MVKKVEVQLHGKGHLVNVAAPEEKATHARRVVFYGTDRKRGAAPTLVIPDSWLLWAALVTALLGWRLSSLTPPAQAGGPPGANPPPRPSLLQRFRRWLRPSHLLLLLTLLLAGGRLAAYFFPREYNPAAVAAYGDERGSLEFGSCVVSIPLSHKPGMIEAPRWLRFEFREDPAKHVTLLRVEPMAREQFAKEIQAGSGGRGHREAMVFVHGFNVSFEDAAKRAAQLTHDMGFDGLAVFYSWPSHGRTMAYTWDEDSARWTVPHLTTFLELLAKEADLDRVHFVAHSMGSRCLAESLKRVNLGRCTVGECVLAAPDIAADEFKDDIAPALLGQVRRLTLYASSKDWALNASKRVHRSVRAGDVGPGIVVLDGMESVDASLLDTDALGHTYYGDSPHLITDLKQLLLWGFPAADRIGMRKRAVGAILSYWEFRPDVG